MVTYEIKVTFRTEGECIYCQEEHFYYVHSSEPHKYIRVDV